MTTKLMKVPLKTTNIEVRQKDARGTQTMGLINGWISKDGKVSDSDLLSKLSNLWTPTAKSGLDYVKVPFSYKDALLDALDTPPVDERSGQPRGFGPREQRKRNKIVDLIEDAADGHVLLENSDYAELKECLDNMKFVFRSKGLEDFFDAIENAEEVEVKADDKKAEEKTPEK